MFRISLRTLLTLFFVPSIALAWSAYSWRWIQLRRELIVTTPIRVFPHTRDECPAAPGGLWLFGERGAKELWSANATPEQVALAAKLYPEAELVQFAGDDPKAELQEWFKDMKPYD